ncbi:5-oxoprolinase subunit PxpB [Pleomorphomonas sp. NRK KF1]|uniref:5-oxoprolinase subunit PxpB n=1 Tax=Pleomorphomonas sp. NRK KF1 TaxID=2943000 RepID=UPI0020438803|nr:5-oxoprolinase subunit PxpB [Pleomorphomonas sp. NRK KF1]MCM5555568.1 5-oxoprolinase subunit PxpB [Pleomorphomonas sp. NRK KF1]
MVDDFTLSQAGTGALLLDVAIGGAFDDARQARLLALAANLDGVEGVEDIVPGMNNLMVVFDPLLVDAGEIERRLAQGWAGAVAADEAGREHEIAVVYGGADLQETAAHLGLAVADVVERHSTAVYKVAAIGAMPGFPYLSGLDSTLAMPRRAVPRQGVPKGAVIVGGGQAGIMPITAPSGWHILGHTDFVLFDPHRAAPATLRPGDTVRFTVAGVKP